ncbi:hypothetical protein MettiDRAFT_1712 [Methanolobus tindarius DSM 2278]|uniref:Uncharacterized protein n=1 Tax=Methanolobus tindarius DSM 2278 TaxID=1090322 RepID=W9DXW2_METTI|nr:hypothetical protein MettiDRAFT_1712 [Methanolobus tindarius DSM 2278]
MNYLEIYSNHSSAIIIVQLLYNSRIIIVICYYHVILGETMSILMETNDYRKSEPSRIMDDDEDYRPILQGVINTRCNYDGGKIEGILD